MGFVSSGPNAAGMSLAGCLPHRVSGGGARSQSGKGVADMLNAEMDAVVLVNVEPDDIHAIEDAAAKIAGQKFVVALTPFVSDALLDAADLLLPVGTFAETSGTYVNCSGTWQSFGGVANPVGESRPTWKVLRVLGNLCDAEGFDYVTSEDVLQAVRTNIGDVSASPFKGSGVHSKPNGEDAPSQEVDTAIYSVDGLVRRAHALQQTLSAKRASGEDS